MGSECSSCKCTNEIEEKILIINHEPDKSFKERKSKLEMKGSQKEIKETPNVKSNISFGKNIKNSIEVGGLGIDKQIRLIQGVMKRFKARKIYLIVRNKIRVRLKIIYRKISNIFHFLKK